MLPLIVFGILAAVALISAVMVITRRNVVHSIIWLIVTLFAVGGIFLLERAEFLFAVQVILYVGGIMVLFLFVVMLVDLQVALKQARFNHQWLLGVFTALLVFAQVVYLIYKIGAGLSLPVQPPGSDPAHNTQAVGLALYQTYMLPVEITSLLLLVAMVGAVIMAKRKFE
jgi:NADH-quinone oxidoreductase subunit J